MAEERDPEGPGPHIVEREPTVEGEDVNVRGRVIGLPVPRAPRRRDGVGRTLWWDEEVTHQRERDGDWMKRTDVMDRTPLNGEVEKDTTPRGQAEAAASEGAEEPLAFDDLTGPMTAFGPGLRLAPKDLDLDAVSFVSAVMVPPDEGSGEGSAEVKQDASPVEPSRPALSFEDKTVVGHIDPMTASGPRPKAAAVAAVLQEVSEELRREEEPLFSPVEATRVIDIISDAPPAPPASEAPAAVSPPVDRAASPPPPGPAMAEPVVVPAPAPLPADLAVSTAPPMVSSQKPRPAKSSWAGRMALLLVLLAVVGGGAFVGYRTWWTHGELVVRLENADGSPVEKAEVFIDGHKVCDTDPCRVSDVKTGKRTVRVIAPGVEPQVTEAKVVREGTTQIWVELPVAPARLAVQGASDVTVRIDGDDFGQLPLSVSLPPGRHELSLSAPGRITVRKVVELTAGETLELGRIEVPAEPPRLKLTLATAGAHVVLIPRHQADKIVVAGPFPRELELPPGGYDLVASKLHYRTFHRRIDTTIEPQLSVVIKLQPRPRDARTDGREKDTGTDYEKPAPAPGSPAPGSAAPESPAPEPTEPAAPATAEKAPEPTAPEATAPATEAPPNEPPGDAPDGTAEGQNLPPTEPVDAAEPNPYD